MNNLLLSLGNIFDIDPITGALKITYQDIITLIPTALLVGIFLSVIYIFTHRKSGYLASMPTTLIVLPVVVATVIMLVGTNYASAFALAGVFTLIRFRSEPGDPKDISYIFATVSAGLCAGMGFIGFAIIISVLVGAILVVTYLTQYGECKKTALRLKILVPEDLNYEDAFNDIFEKFGVKAFLDKVKTADFGTIYELVYRLNVGKDFKQKDFIDALRTRNGNLNILLTLSENLYTKNA